MTTKPRVKHGTVTILDAAPNSYHCVGTSPAARATATQADRPNPTTAIKAGESQDVLLAVMPNYGQVTGVVFNGTRETPVEAFDRHELSSRAAAGWLKDTIRAHGVTVVSLSEGAISNLFAADYPNRVKAEALAGSLQSVADSTGASFTLVHPAAPAAPAPLAPPEIAADVVDGLLIRGKVTQLDAEQARSAGGLLDAMGQSGRASWLGHAVSGGSTVHVAGGGRHVPWLSVTLRDIVGRASERRYDTRTEFLNAQQWLGHVLTENGAAVLLLVDAEALQAGEFNPAMALDPDELAKDLNVAVGVL